MKNVKIFYLKNYKTHKYLANFYTILGNFYAIFDRFENAEESLSKALSYK